MTGVQTCALPIYGQWHGSGAQDQADLVRYAKEFDEVESWYVLERTIADDSGLENGVIDPFEGCDARIRVLWGQVRRLGDKDWSYGDYSDENNHSVVVRIDFGRASLLFTGDLEEGYSEDKGGIELLLEKYEGTDLLDVDVYQVGHHGSHNGTTTELVAAMSPKYAVISAGPACERSGYSAWQHGHPRTRTIRDLQNGVQLDRVPKEASVFPGWREDPETWTISKAIYSTGWDGTVVLEADETGAWDVTEGTPHSCLMD